MTPGAPCGPQLAVALLVLAALGSGAAPRAATGGHGGVVQVDRVPAGPYFLTVRTQPVPARPGPWQVDVAVMREGSAPVGDARVRVRAEPVGGGTPIEADAHRDADPLRVRYRASLALTAAGPWRVTVSAAGPAGAGARAFPVDVEPASRGWWPAVALGAAGLAILVALIPVRRRRRLAGIAAVLVLATATGGWPHASLVRSSPGRRAMLTTPPERVQLWFNEAIEPRFSNVTVWDSAGQRVDLRDARVEPDDPTRLTIGLAPLARGSYRVRFRVLSVDGHVVESEFPFTLR